MHCFVLCVFVLDSDDVSIAEIEDVRKMIQLLSFYQGRLSDAAVISEDEICTICYAYPISAIFKPCNHHSCRYIPNCSLVCYRNLILCMYYVHLASHKLRLQVTVHVFCFSPVSGNVASDSCILIVSTQMTQIECCGIHIALLLLVCEVVG
jgi:hypothetical protein